MDELRELKRKADFFQAENEKLRGYIEELEAELQGITVALASSDEFIASFASVTRGSELSRADIGTRKDRLTDQINAQRLRAKAALADEASSEALRDVLATELEGLNLEREMILRKLKDLKDGIRRIELDKERIVPYGKQQDDMLKKAYLLLKEAQDRMELSIILKK